MRSLTTSGIIWILRRPAKTPSPVLHAKTWSTGEVSGQLLITNVILSDHYCTGAYLCNGFFVMAFQTKRQSGRKERYTSFIQNFARNLMVQIYSLWMVAILKWIPLIIFFSPNNLFFPLALYLYLPAHYFIFTAIYFFIQQTIVLTNKQCWTKKSNGAKIKWVL